MAEHTYFVVSPEVPIAEDVIAGSTLYLDGCYVVEVRASSKREALRIGVQSGEFRDWVHDARADGRNPWSGVRVEHPTCKHHDCCCAFDEGCPECAAEWDAECEQAGVC